MYAKKAESSELPNCCPYYTRKSSTAAQASEPHKISELDTALLHPYPNTFLEGRLAADSDSDQAGRGRRRRMATVATVANTLRPNYHPLSTRTGARAGTHPP